jgi:MraZ protein
VGTDHSEGSARIVFVGEYDRSVDGNGRLALPAPFRDELGDRCYVTTDPGGFVAITTVTNFEADATTLLEEVRNGLLPESALRNFGVNSSIVAIDKQGRITLDEGMRRHAGITSGSQAILAGALSKLEVWRPSRYGTVRGEDAVQQPARVWMDEATR